MNFNFDHLTPLEHAARLFCASQDQNPDEPMEVPHPMGLQGVKFTRPAWHFPAENMLNLSTMLACMREAALQVAANNAEPKQH